MKVLEKGCKPHHCKPPNIIERFFKGLKNGAIIECDCGKKWEWKADYMSWDRIYEPSDLPLIFRRELQI